MLVEKIDWDLNRHYESSDDFQDIYQHGYTVKFNTERVIKDVRENFGYDVEAGVTYRFTDGDLFKSLQSHLGDKEKHYAGILGDDGWVLYRYKFDRVEYWDSLYGEGYIKERYPVYGKGIWDRCKDLKKIEDRKI